MMGREVSWTADDPNTSQDWKTLACCLLFDRSAEGVVAFEYRSSLGAIPKDGAHHQINVIHDPSNRPHLYGLTYQDPIIPQQMMGLSGLGSLPPIWKPPTFVPVNGYP